MRGLMRYFFLLLAMLFWESADAQEAQRELRLTLDECVATALSNNPTILQIQYDVAIAETNVDQARNSFLPTSTVSWGISRNISGPREGAILDPSTGVLIQTLGESRVGGGQSVGISSVSIPVYNGTLIANLSASKNSLKQTEMTRISNRGDVVFLVKQRYFQLLQAMKLLEVQQERVLVSEESLRRAETLYEIGSAAILQVTNARSSLANARAILIQRENAVLIARLQLGFIMGLGTDVDIVPAQEEFPIELPDLTYDDALSLALDRHPGIQATRYSMLAARDNFRATRHGLYHPTISMSAGYGWNLGKDEKFGGLEDLFLKNYSYNVNLNVSMPIFNMNTTNNLKRQRLQYLRSQEVLDQTKRQKALNIKQAYLNLEQFRRSIEANEVAVEAAEENFKLEEERYNFGGGTFLERLTAQTNLFDARNSLVQAQYNYLIQMAQLENELGRLSAGDSED